MHGVAAAVGAWLDAGDDRVVVRAPLTQVLAFGRGGQSAGALLGGAVDDVAAWSIRSGHRGDDRSRP